MLRNKSQIAKICGVKRNQIEICVNLLKINPYAKISKIPYYNENQFNKIVEVLQPEYLTFESKMNDQAQTLENHARKKPSFKRVLF